MAVPKRKVSRSKKGMRRSHDALRPATPGRCGRCNQACMPHRICANCGWYRGRRAIFGDDAVA